MVSIVPSPLLDRIYEFDTQLNNVNLLAPEAVHFLSAIHRKFASEIQDLLKARELRNGHEDEDWHPDVSFEAKTKSVKDWRAKKTPTEIVDRRVETFGPATAKSVINGLNSDAKVYVADLEQGAYNGWGNTLISHLNLYQAQRGILDFDDVREGKYYSLKKKRAVLFVKPRELQRAETNFVVDGKAISAALFDFALYFFHNAEFLVQKGSAPYFYLPKVEHTVEAKFWNKVMNYAQDYVGLKRGTIKAAILIESVQPAFHLEELLYAIKDHSIGLNFGLKDFIGEQLELLESDSTVLASDEKKNTKLEAYQRKAVAICHDRGVHALGGLPFISDTYEGKLDEVSQARLKTETIREAIRGFDGVVVENEAQAAFAKEVLNTYMPEKNQIGQVETETERSLHYFRLQTGSVTVEDIRQHINKTLQFLSAWLAGNDNVGVIEKMGGISEAEFSRAQLRHWFNRKSRYGDKSLMSEQLFAQTLEEQKMLLLNSLSLPKEWRLQLPNAERVLNEMVMAPKVLEFFNLGERLKKKKSQTLLTSSSGSASPFAWALSA